MKPLDIGCWEYFRKKYNAEALKWMAEQARIKGVLLEDDTEVCYSYLPEQERIYFGKEAIDEALGYISAYKRSRIKRINIEHENYLPFFGHIGHS